MKDLEKNPIIQSRIDKATLEGDTLELEYLKGFYAAAKYTIWLYDTFEDIKDLRPDSVFLNWSRDGQPSKELKK